MTKAQRIVVSSVGLILYAPLIVVIIMSFNRSLYGTFPFSFSLKWYSHLLKSDDLLIASSRSIWLSFGVALLATTIGTMFAVWSVSVKSVTGLASDGILLATVAIPWLILGIAMLQIFNLIRIGRGIVSAVIGNVAVVLPYVVFVVMARLSGLDENLIEAGRSLARPN